MIVTGQISQVRAFRSHHTPAQIGFVPTMGYLHEGHLSLVQQAKEENDVVVVSIFVNPTQFAPTEDLETYPHNLERDLQLLAELKVDLVFNPDTVTMYPPGFQTIVLVEQLSTALEGRTRPSHFQGVTTVVAKLFNIVQPTRAYFGQKDAQQCVVIKRMVGDLDLDLEIVVCPIVREHDGLAMSSRNVRLAEKDRAAAPIISHALLKTAELYTGGERSCENLRQFMLGLLATESRARVDYVSVADPQSLEELVTIENEALLSTAVYFGDVRLIDNLLLA
ncbi:MAG TPA: pantoate--beta-alanine ligase [candidate division Zixibacteria bacterium]|nr:pantoate--beta-alanine ligase [candidate division Zixibacteria bacterium]